MTNAEIRSLAVKWVAIIRTHADRTVDLGLPKPGWPDMPPVGPDRIEVTREILTQLGPGYMLETVPAEGLHLLVCKDDGKKN